MSASSFEYEIAASGVEPQSFSQINLGPTSYNDAPAWREIQGFFPSQWQIPPSEQPEEETYDWRGCSIHIDSYRNSGSPVRVLMLHGLGTNARMMSMVAGHALARLGYETSAIDMPYVGATRAPHRRFRYADWVQLVSDYINADHGRDDRPVVLFGFSVGGMLSYDVSCINHRVAGVCATSFIDLSQQKVRREIAPNPDWSMLMEKIGSFVLRCGFQPNIPLKTFASPTTISNEPRLNEVLASDPASLGGMFPLAFLDSLRWHKPTIDPEDYDLCPVALFQPELDYNIPPATNADFISRIPGNTETTVLPAAGHIPLNIEALQMLADNIGRFAKRCADHPTSCQPTE